MDLSFHRTGSIVVAGARPATGLRVPAWPFLRAAAAARQGASPTAIAVAGVLRGQDEAEDWVQALGAVFAPRSDGRIDAVRLAGSFNPLVAGQFRVGQE